MDASDFDGRLSAAEQKVRELDGRVRATAQDAAAARVLAGAADRDVSEFRAELTDFRRATTGSFNALREDVVEGFAEMRRKFADIDARFHSVDQGFHSVDQGFQAVDRGFAEMRGKLDATAAGQQQIVDLIQQVIEKDD